jgi:hypothetical protein
LEHRSSSPWATSAPAASVQLETEVWQSDFALTLICLHRRDVVEPAGQELLLAYQ